MEKLPDFTWPSSSVQPSERLYWKYRSASSALWARMVPKTFCVATSSIPNGDSRVALAMSRVLGPGLVNEVPGRSKKLRQFRHRNHEGHRGLSPVWTAKTGVRPQFSQVYSAGVCARAEGMPTVRWPRAGRLRRILA